MNNPVYMHQLFKGELSVRLWLNGFIYQQITDLKIPLKKAVKKTGLPMVVISLRIVNFQ